jgi:hypothetical protein
MRIPGKLTGSSSLVPWLNALREAILSVELKSGVGYRVRNSSEGQVVEILGSGGSSGIRWKIPKELDPDVAVSKDELVFISPDNALVGTGLIDLATSELAYCPPGEWLCVKDCPAATEAGYNVPKLLPLTGANLADAPTVYWVLQQEHNPCVGV